MKSHSGPPTHLFETRFLTGRIRNHHSYQLDIQLEDSPPASWVVFFSSTVVMLPVFITSVPDSTLVSKALCSFAP
jgi:hypothetical protein